MSGLDKRFCCGGADIACAAGYKDFHGYSCIFSNYLPDIFFFLPPRTPSSPRFNGFLGALGALAVHFAICTVINF
jgi:hypothetical protein